MLLRKQPKLFVIRYQKVAAKLFVNPNPLNPESTKIQHHAWAIQY